MAKTLTVADRLNLLLVWLNDERWDQRKRWRDKELQSRLSRFIKSFDGSENAGYVCAEVDTTDEPPAFLTRGLEGIDDYEVLHTVLVDTLRRGFPNAPPSPFPDRLELPSLRFGIEGQAPARLRGREWHRLKKRAGAYVLRVTGAEFALVPWLVMHLLTQPGAVSLRRCEAPRPYTAERCGQFFVRGGPGRPREFCSDRCRQQSYWAQSKVGRRRGRNPGPGGSTTRRSVKRGGQS